MATYPRIVEAHQIITELTEVITKSLELAKSFKTNRRVYSGESTLKTRELMQMQTTEYLFKKSLSNKTLKKTINLYSSMMVLPRATSLSNQHIPYHFR